MVIRDGIETSMELLGKEQSVIKGRLEDISGKIDNLSAAVVRSQRDMDGKINSLFAAVIQMQSDLQVLLHQTPQETGVQPQGSLSTQRESAMEAVKKSGERNVFGCAGVSNEIEEERLEIPYDLRQESDVEEFRRNMGWSSGSSPRVDQVYHSAWHDLCKGMSAARSLDEVIEVHDAYLLSIQRQCFVVPDKLWALIASRINTILGLTLEFCSIQQTLNSGGPISGIKARCEMEVDRIEKQFDDCIAFLLRVLSLKLNVGHFPHLVDLVTRINYNYYYMSDSGNVVNNAAGPSSENVKLGKSFPLKTGFGGKDRKA